MEQPISHYDQTGKFERAFKSIITLQSVFFAMSLLLLLLVFLFRNSLNEFVWMRSIGLAALSLLFIFFGLKLRDRKRSTYIRLLVIAIAGTIGIAFLALFGSDVYPLWMRIEQALQGLVLLAIIVVLVQPAIRTSFARQPQSAHL